MLNVRFSVERKTSMRQTIFTDHRIGTKITWRKFQFDRGDVA